MTTELNINTILIPKSITLRIDENKISICYRAYHNLKPIGTNEIFLNFTPSKELMDILKKEIEAAINKG